MEFTLNNSNAPHMQYEYFVDDRKLGEISWVEREGVMHMDHTFVSGELRGQGVAKKLLDAAATYARENNFKMNAICSYVVDAFAKNEEYNDVKA